MSQEAETLIDQIARKSDSQAESVLATARRVADREVQSAGRRASTRERVARRELEGRAAVLKAQAQAEAGAKALRMKLTARHDLAERILAAAFRKLAAEERNDGYLDVLTRLAREAAAALGAGDALVAVSASDREFLAAGDRFARLAAAVREASGVSVKLSDESVSTAGGVVLRTADGRVSYYNTFEEVAYRMGPRLRQMIAEELFG